MEWHRSSGKVKALVGIGSCFAVVRRLGMEGGYSVFLWINKVRCLNNYKTCTSIGFWVVLQCNNCTVVPPESLLKYTGPKVMSRWRVEITGASESRIAKLAGNIRALISKTASVSELLQS